MHEKAGLGWVIMEMREMDGFGIQFGGRVQVCEKGTKLLRVSLCIPYFQLKWVFLGHIS